MRYASDLFVPNAEAEAQGEDVTCRPMPSDVRLCDGWWHLVISTTWPFAPELLRDDTSLRARCDAARQGT